MAVYKGTQDGRAVHATSYAGNAWSDTNKITPTTLALNDEVVVMFVPAGVKLTKLRYRLGDLDTGTTLAYKVGYRSKHADPDVASVLDYFGSGLTAGQSAVATWTDYVFDDITFQEPVEIVLTVTTATTGISGTPSLYYQADGVVVGVT